MFNRSHLKGLIVGLILLLILSSGAEHTISSVRGFEERTDTRAQTFIVNRTGGGDYTTIQAAVDAADSGDSIIIETGTYYEHVVVSEKSLTITGEDAQEVKIDGEEVGTGLELQSDGNHIESIWIEDTQNGLVLSSSSENVIIDCYFVNNDFAGIKSNGDCFSNNIDDCTANGNNYAMRLDDGFENNEISNCVIRRNYYGIYLSGADNNEFQLNTCEENEQRRGDGRGRDFFTSTGIYLDENSNGNTFDDNICSNNGDHGIYMFKSSANEFTDNVCENNGGAGIYLLSANNNDIIDNSAHDNDGSGIHLHNSASINIDKNDCFGNLEHSIVLDSCQHIRMKNNTLEESGIFIAGYDLENWNTHIIEESNSVQGKTIGYFKNKETGVLVGNNYGEVILANCTNITVKGVAASNGSIGIMLAFSSFNTIQDNECINNRLYGIMLQSNSNYNRILNNRCNNNKHGIYIDEFCIYNEMDSNSCNYNDNAGIYISPHSNQNSVSNHSSHHNDNGIELLSSNNQVADSQLISNSEYGIIIRSGSASNTIQRSTCNDNQYGIYVDHSTSNRVLQNTCTMNNGSGIHFNFVSLSDIIGNDCGPDNGDGINVRDSEDIIIEQNNADNNSYGMVVSSSQDSIISHNKIHMNSLDGILVSDSSNGEVFENTISSNDRYGIRSWGSSSLNSIQKNDIKNNGNFGFYLESGSNNEVHSNNFIDNGGDSSQGLDNGSQNNWDDGVGKGNYWSDYGDRYPSAQFSGNKWLTPYSIYGSGNSDDDFPYVGLVDIVPPEADAGNDLTIDQNSLHHFNGKGSTDNIGIMNYTWEFIYDQVMNRVYGASASFMFTIVGEYKVTLVVEDGMGNTHSDIIIITVRDTEPPRVVIGDDTTLLNPGPVNIDPKICRDNVGIVNYTWNLSYDDTFHLKYDKTFSFIFNIPGRYTAVLTVTDSEGNTASDRVNVTLKDSVQPLAKAGSDQTIMKGETLSLNATGSYDNVGIVNYTWSFTYNSTLYVLYGEVTEFNFFESGTFKITLMVKDKFGNNDTDEVIITVNNPDLTDDDNDDDINPADDDDIGPNGNDDKEESKSGLGKGLTIGLIIGLVLFLGFIIILLILIKKRSSNKEKSREYDEEYQKLYGSIDRKKDDSPPGRVRVYDTRPGDRADTQLTTEKMSKERKKGQKSDLVEGNKRKKPKSKHARFEGKKKPPKPPKPSKRSSKTKAKIIDAEIVESDMDDDDWGSEDDDYYEEDTYLVIAANEELNRDWDDIEDDADDEWSDDDW